MPTHRHHCESPFSSPSSSTFSVIATIIDNNTHVILYTKTTLLF
jgi:hypothetical protein